MRAADLARLHLMLFGGEPLVNAKGALALLTAAQEQLGLRDSLMVTNATLLTPRLARQLEDVGLSDVQVTFDGDQASHDQLRVTRSGAPSAPSTISSSGVRVPRGGDDTNHKPRATASS